MDRERAGNWWELLPPGLRGLPADLAAVFGVVAAINLAVFLPVVDETPLRVVLGLPFVLFVPGYAFIAALFPEGGGSPTGEGGTTEPETGTVRDRGIDGVERVALSFGTSIAVVPLIGLVLNFTPWGIRLAPIMVATSGFTVCAAWVAARRRWALPPEDRFRVPYRAWMDAARGELFHPDSRTDAALNVLLVVSIVLAVSSVAYAVAVPKQGESFTEFYLLTENEDGELVAADYPTEFVAGEGREVVVGVGNQEHEPVTYTVIVELQQVEFGTADAGPATNATSVRVVETEQLRRFRTELDHNETWQRPYTVRPTLVGKNLRLVFLLYRGAPPENPGVDTAYRETHLWINVTRS